MYMEQLMIDIINYYCINQKNSLIHKSESPMCEWQSSQSWSWRAATYASLLGS